jgi:hypothetical protein
MRYLILIFVIACISISCNQPGTRGKTTATDTSAAKVDYHQLPELRSVDSIDMHFFSDIKDQKIYTRFGLNDTSVINIFTLTEINHPFVDQPACEYDTKFFCFSKGQIVKTLYVAALKDSCHFIGFIKSGGIAVRVQLSDSAASMVNKWRNTYAR